jgi:hypothetical protein
MSDKSDAMKLFEAAMRQLPEIAADAGRKFAAGIEAAATGVVARTQRGAGEAQTLQQAAERERTELMRVMAAARAEGVKLDEANEAKRQQGAKLDEANAALATKIREAHDELEKITAAVVATNRASRPVAV